MNPIPSNCQFVEAGSYEDMFYSPHHPYTAALLASAGLMESQNAASRFELKHDMPNPKNLPPGCTLNPRCPFVSDRCRTEYPNVVDVGSGHYVACHNTEALLATKPGVAQ